MASERNAEGASGAVADAFGHFGNGYVFLLLQLLRPCHAQGEQVFHRGDADCVIAALEECRAGEGGFIR